MTEVTGVTGVPPRVAVVIVAWNSAAHVGAAVRSVPAGVGVVVVDNASTDESSGEAEAAGARVIRPGRNLGFGAACNLGARETASETILFLNPDAEIDGGHACLDPLLAALDADPSVGAVAPALSGDGQERFQLRRLPTPASIAREALLVNRLAPDNAGLRAERYLDRDRSVPFDVEQPAGAALVVRRDVFDALGGFDPAFAPAWFEDVDLCARILESGRTIRFVPAARARHVGGTTMRALPYRDFRPLYVRNELRYFRRHASVASQVAIRALEGVGAALRLVLLPLFWGDHPRVDAAVAHLRVLRGVLGLGWRSALIEERV